MFRKSAVAVLLLLAFAVTAGAQPRFHRYRFEIKRRTTLGGTIVRVIKVKPLAGRFETVAVVLRTPEGDEVEVRLGPQFYLDNLGLRLTPGATLHVAVQVVEYKGKEYWIARQVGLNGKKWVFREADGAPMWRAFGRRGGPRGNL
ncbi:MAG: hypothetical protein GXO73_13435 [Calditrichaeota bacterium]|nr:hypothetical protein [Calditrichota bacterium]